MTTAHRSMFTPRRQWLAVGVCMLTLAACEVIEDGASNNVETPDVLQSQVTGMVTDNRGEPIAGATVQLFDLVGNTNFVEGGDVRTQEAYIKRDAILSSDNAVETTQTGEDGKFVIEGVFPSALLAVATKEGCTADFAGFDEETGVLSLSTLIAPDENLDFAVPTFVIACATAPEAVLPDGNTEEAPAFEPPTLPPTCDEQQCTAAGGTCDGADCSLPTCSSDEECQAGQPGAFCENPGDVDLAACRAPLPGEIVPPEATTGWTGFRITDTDDALLADASEDNDAIAASAIPGTGLGRVHGAYMGDAEKAYVHVQTGSQNCPELPPRTDFFAVEVIDGAVTGEVFLHGGYQQITLSTSDTLGEGDQSFVIEVGEPCAPPQYPFIAIMTWDAGPGQPADLDLNVWNGAGDLVFVGEKQAAWGQLHENREGPGPEVFRSEDATQGPFTIKAQFFSGRPRAIEAKVRILRVIDGQLSDDTYVFTVDRPKDVAEIGVFESE